MKNSRRTGCLTSSLTSLGRLSVSAEIWYQFTPGTVIVSLAMIAFTLRVLHVTFIPTTQAKLALSMSISCRITSADSAMPVSKAHHRGKILPSKMCAQLKHVLTFVTNFVTRHTDIVATAALVMPTRHNVCHAFIHIVLQETRAKPFPQRLSLTVPYVSTLCALPQLSSLVASIYSTPSASTERYKSSKSQVSRFP